MPLDWRPPSRPAPAMPQGLTAWLQGSLERSASADFWQACALLHAWLLYLAVRYSLDTQYSGLFELVLAPIHEGGHVLFGPLGMFMGVLGGSLLQWLAPLFLAAGFVRQRDLYALSFSFFLFGAALNQSYCYMDSSFQMEKYPDMVFISLGSGEAIHDWQYIFGALGLYRGYTTVALLTRAMGLGFIWLAWLAGAWVLWKMSQRNSAQ
jgi:hypothetical protein